MCVCVGGGESNFSKVSLWTAIIYSSSGKYGCKAYFLGGGGWAAFAQASLKNPKSAPFAREIEFYQSPQGDGGRWKLPSPPSSHSYGGEPSAQMKKADSLVYSYVNMDKYFRT